MKVFDMSNIVACICEHDDGKIVPATLEALGFATELASLTSCKIVSVVIGEDALDIATYLNQLSGLPSLAVNVAGLKEYNSEAYKAAARHAIELLGPDYVCVAGTTQGFDFAPGLAARSGMACISNVEGILERNDEPVFVRSVFNGKILAELRLDGQGLIIVQPGRFRFEKSDSSCESWVRQVSFDYEPVKTRVLSNEISEAADSSLSDASVIIAAGRGLRHKENLELIKKVAQLFSSSAVAGSRPLCDNGWLPFRLQVGQTGATVAPELYMACGISGSQQHLAGMRGSKLVVAINVDSHAPIFLEADIGIVEDLEEFLKNFCEVATRS
ncbi:MAG: electron transfer flavoprotein subunit alpha/FixB family protein [Desulfomonilaceae bacterium]